MSEEAKRRFLVNYAVDHLTAFLLEDRHISLEQALDIIYSSRIYDLLQDEAAGLSSESPAYLYELLKTELASPPPAASAPSSPSAGASKA